jgi:hypothetical protein
LEKIERLVHTTCGIYLFSFQKIFTSKEDKYFVSVMDKSLNPYFFNMVKIDESWRIVNAPEVPRWILEVETELSGIIRNPLVFVDPLTND